MTVMNRGAQSLKKLKQDMIKICRLMHNKGLTNGTDGNLSIRLSGDRFLFTPSGISKGFVEEGELLVINKKAEIIKGKRGLKPSSEWQMHLRAFELRPDISAVIHAHPPYTISFCVAGLRMPGCVLPEVVMTMGDIPVTDYAPPASPQNAGIIEKYIGDYDAVILNRHGSLTVGPDIFAAYNKLESVENAALVSFAATALGGIKPLTRGEVKSLYEMGKKLGLLNRQTICNNCGFCEKPGKGSV
jgi:L-fuculose-phosphate aldolase